MVKLIRSDLDFILQQILIAEAEAAGIDPATLVPNSFVPFGLRTLTGRFNNLFPGQDQFGAADNLFPRLLTPTFLNEGDGDTFDPDGPGPAPSITNTNYDTNISVVDSDPRIISNLISDQTAANFAAVAANGDAAPTVSPGLDGVFGTADDRDVFFIPNVTPDEGLSAPFNSWMTFFGQFFDHGLDLVTKGGDGTVYIPLQADDPLIAGADGNFGTSDDLPVQQRFMAVTRATQFVDVNGVRQTENTTSPFVDQNQTYSSHPSHQVFLRAYELGADGKPHATGKLIENVNLGADGRFGGPDADIHIGGMATWGVVKAQARDLLGIELTDMDVFNVPLLRTDAYGKFIPATGRANPAENGFAQVITGAGADGVFNTADDDVIVGTPTSPVSLTMAVRTGHAFLNDLAHNADPSTVFDPDGPTIPDPDNPGQFLGTMPAQVVQADGDNVAGNAIATDFRGRKVAYDDELLDAHYIAGDGRVNENIGLTAVHAVFHAEHNRLVEHTKDLALADAQALLTGGATQAQAVAFLNNWLSVPVTEISPLTTKEDLTWNGERLFQTAKFGTEMQYQHLVFEEFARRVQPQVDAFLAPTGFDTTIDASIVAEFAHTVYRFGHSMLTETVDRLDPNFNVVGDGNPTEVGNQQSGLIAMFLNPLAFAASGATPEAATGAIVRGVTRQAGNAIDEFVTEALRNNLVGLPLDLPAINIARGRDTGVPSLNEARRQFYEMTTDSQLKPYTSWVDFAQNIKHPESLVNFIAAYGTHTSTIGATTTADKRTAAYALVYGEDGMDGIPGSGDEPTVAVPGDRLDFLYATGAWAGGSLGGLNAIDFWIGGLAEKEMPFGGLLGSSFSFVFETQMESLQNGDRFYYLARTAGMNFATELENNSFAKLIMRNSDVVHLPADVFSTPAYTLEVNPLAQFTGLGASGRDDPQGGTTIQGVEVTPLVIRDNPATVDNPLTPFNEATTNYLQYTGEDHVVLGGTAGDDILIASIGDDTLWGDGGNDRLEGGDGVDNIEGGAGDDIITDLGGDDILKGNDGNDVISGGNGLNILFGGSGSDFIITGEDVSDTFGGTGNDFILGAQMNLPTFGNEGDDWIEIGTSDGAAGDNFDPLEASTVIGHDVAITGGGFDSFDGEGGDDIMVFSDGEDHFTGGGGFDWASYANDGLGVTADLLVNDLIEPPVTPSNQGIKDRFAEVEGLSGSSKSDILRGDNADAATIGAGGALDGTLNQAGIARIAGLQALLGAGVTSFNAGNIILGGGGSDIIEGRGGDDLIDGDRALNVRIGVYAAADTDHTGPQIATFQTMTDPTLLMNMLNGVWNPGQLQITREILPGAAAFDTAMYSGLRADYDIAVNGTVIAGNVFNIGATDIVTVTDNVNLDGIDTLKSIERLQFSDVAVVLRPGLNNGPVGVLTIDDATPEIGQVLTASAAGVTDADNPGTITNRPVTYIWQAERVPGSGVFTDIVGLGGGNPETAHGNTFRVTADVAGLALRVRAVYQDALGTLESVFSGATGPVTGVAAIPVAPVLPVESATVSAGVRLIRADLQFILDQIKLSEANPDGNVLGDIQNSRLPFGLRTVDGSFNNLVQGQTTFGQADRDFVLLLDQIFRDDQDGDTFDKNGDAPGGSVTNTDYATSGNTVIAGVASGDVVDADPRIISNLISDQTAANLSAMIANGDAEAVLSPGLDGVFGTADDREVYFIPNATPDEGLSAPFNSWFTFFGQFFDHGLDLVNKGGEGTVYIPLQADDPLIAGANGIFGDADDLAPQQRFMAVTRATNTSVSPGLDNVLGTADDVHTANNQTTPFVDQNQTYTSHASHQVYLREYKLNAAGDPVSTGRLIDGMVGGGIGNWAEVKAQAADMLGLRMNDMDIFNAPLLVTDAYGKFIPGATGFAQVHVSISIVSTATGALISTVPGVFIMEGRDTDDDTLQGLDLHNLDPLEVPGFTAAVLPAGQEYRVATVGTGHAFLDDIAHNAVPGTMFDPDGPDPDGPGPIESLPDQVVQADGDNVAGTVIPTDFRGRKMAYDDELLDAHFITGDGRGNENIGLSSVHFVFHAEHNRLVGHIKDVAAASNDASFISQWLIAPISQAQLDDINALAPALRTAALEALDWNGERIFQAARFGTEMQYQHLVFEEFARKVQPQVDVFLMEGQGYDSTINPAIVAEFAHVVYRFGHSMLTETVDRYDPNFNLIDADPLHPLQDGSGQQIGLIAAFLNPLAFAASGATHAEAAGAIIRGVTRQVGNEIDEFVTEALRNNLVGLPLDLPAINLARGRDTGVPTLNQARTEFFSWTGDSQLKPYTSWADFVQHIKHPESLINFVAAYGTHPFITTETTLEGKRAAAMAIVTGDSVTVFDGTADERDIVAPADRLDFLNATGIYAPDGLGGPNDDSRGGLNNIDLWIGGLAEKQMPFGGLLGSTFNYVFENQMEKLQNGDRFYYLERTAGLNFLTELENNSFAKLIMANTDTTHLSGDVFSTPTWILEVDQTKQFTGIENVQQAIGQAGTVTVTQTSDDLWHSVSFTGPIDDAVVVMMVNTNNELQPALVRVRNVTADGFEFKIDEWDDDNGRGTLPETLSWLAMSEGEHVLPDGTHIRAGVRAVNDTVASISFGAAFASAPVVLTQVSTYVDPSTVTTRLNNVTAAGFDVRLQEQQVNIPAHGVEQVGWIAIAQAVTGTAAARADDLIGHITETIDYGAAFLTPVFLAQMQTQIDQQTAAVRGAGLGVAVGGTSSDVFVQEEASVDPDLTHTPETIGFVALNTGVILPEVPTFNADPTEGGTALMPLVLRNNPATSGLDSNYLQYTGVDHVVLGGTAGDDIIISSIGDDTLYGDAGDDRLEGGDGVDMILGGAGDDIITDKGGDDNLQGGEGDDAIHAGNGINLILGGFGNDYIVTGEDSNEAFGGPGNDFIFGTRADEMQFGNEGDDWIEHGMADGSAGENFDTRGLDSIIGHDVFIGDTVSDRMLGEGGDDIMLGNGGQIDRYIGASGFDWASYKNDPMYNNVGLAANVDLNLRAFNETRVPPSVASVLDRFESVEGLSGSSFGDILRGDDLDAAQIALSGFTGSVLTNFSLIAGLREFVAEAGDGLDLLPDTLDDEFHAGNIILGGDGSDLIEGRGGDDLIDGDLALNVQIRRVELDLNGNPVLADGLMIELERFDSMIEVTGRVFSGEIDPGSLFIVREIVPLDIGAPGFVPDPDFDTALFSGNLADYTIDIDDRGTADTFDDIVTVTDNVALRDGVDRLTHMERLQFNDQSVVLVPVGNAEPVGLLTILNAATNTPDGTPQTGQVLRVSTTGVTDGDNVAGTNTAGAITGAPITFVWQFEPIPGTGIFQDIVIATGLGDLQATGETFTVTADLVGLALRVRALFLDAHGVLETVFSAATTAVEVPAAPVITSNGAGNTAAVTIDENLAAVTTVTAPDANTDDVVTFSIVGGADAARFAIDPLTGALSFATAPDFEVPTDDDFDNVYDVTVRASDGVLFDEQAIAVTVNDVGNIITGTGGVNTMNATTGTVSAGMLVNGVAQVAGAPGATSEEDIISGLSGADTLVGLGGNDIIEGGFGNDTIDAGSGDDLITWNANAVGPTDGRDLVDGGGGASTTDTDTFVVNGNSNGEIYNIYTRTAFLDEVGNAGAPIAPTTEIVITRNGTDNASVIAELANIEEIRINGVDPSGLTGSAAGDTFNIIGDFSTTSLNPNTIWINGGGGHDKLDISEFVDSGHRFWFESGDGNDTIIGSPRDQDVYDPSVTIVPSGPRYDPADFFSFREGSDRNDGMRGTNRSDLMLGHGGHDMMTGRDGNDVLIGGAGRDRMDGGQGNDTFVFAAGSGRDMIINFGDRNDNQDFIDLVELDITAGNFAQRVKIQDIGAHTLITIDGDHHQSITLVGVGNANNIGIDDFFLK